VGTLSFVLPVVGLIGLIGLLVGVLPTLAYAGLAGAYLYGEYARLTARTAAQAPR
jgi:hypothetical protein